MLFVSTYVVACGYFSDLVQLVVQCRHMHLSRYAMIKVAQGQGLSDGIGNGRQSKPRWYICNMRENSLPVTR
jgi:hypothetical protein